MSKKSALNRSKMDSKRSDFNGDDSLSQPVISSRRTIMQSRKSFVFFNILVMFFLAITNLFSMSNIASTRTLDVDNNGEIDRLVVEFAVPMNIVDLNPGGGLDILDIEEYVIGAGDYSATNAANLVLTIVEEGVKNTYDTTSATYKVNPVAGNITVSSNNFELADNTTSDFTYDGAAPVISRAIVGDPAAGELVLQFSEPISRDTGSNTLIVSDFTYTDMSGGNVTSISAMGSDSDSADSAIKVLVNTSFAPADFGVDKISISSANIVDAVGLPAANTEVFIEQGPNTGANVEMSFAFTPPEIKQTGLAILASIEVMKLNGSTNIVGFFSGADISFMGVSQNDITEIMLIDDQTGNPLHSGSYSLDMNGNVMMSSFDAQEVLASHVFNSILIMGNVQNLGGNVLNIEIDPSNFETTGYVQNGGNVTSLVSGNINLGTAPVSDSLAVAPVPGGFTPPTISGGETSIDLMKFELNPTSGSPYVTGITITANGSLDTEISNFNLYRESDGALIDAQSAIVGNVITFSSMTETVAAIGNYVMRGDVAANPVGNSITFELNPVGGNVTTSATVTGSPVTAVVNKAGSSDSLAVGPVAGGFTPPTVSGGDTGIDLMKFELNPTSGSPVVTGITITANGSLDSEITNLTLIREIDSFQVGGPLSMISGNILTFSGMNESVTAIGNYILRGDVAVNPTGSSVTFELNPVGGNVATTAAVSGSPITSIVNASGGSDSLTVMRASGFAPPTSVAENATAFHVMELDMSNTGSPVVDVIKFITASATATTNFTNYQLYSNVNAGFIGGMPAISGNEITFTLAPQTVSTFDTWILKANVNMNVAGNSETFSVDPSADLAVSTGTVTGSLISETYSITPQPVAALLVQPTPAFVPGNFVASAGNIEVMKVRFGPINSEFPNLQQVTFRVTSGDIANISQARFFSNVVGSIAGNSITFNLGGWNVDGTYDLPLWIDVAPNLIGNGITFELDPFTDLSLGAGNVDGTSISPIVSTFSFGNAPQGNTADLTVNADSSFMPPATLNAGDTNVDLLAVQFDALSSSDVYSFNASLNGDYMNVVNFRLTDINNNLIGNAAPSGNMLYFSFSQQTITGNATKWKIIADVAGNAASGSFGIQVDPMYDIAISMGNIAGMLISQSYSIAGGNAPQGNTVDDLLVKLDPNFVPASTVNAGDVDVDLMVLNLEALNSGTTVDGFQFSVFGPSLPDFENFRLYDINDLTTPIANGMMMGNYAQFGNLNQFITGNSIMWKVVADVPTGAYTGNTYLGLDPISDFTLANGGNVAGNMINIPFFTNGGNMGNMPQGNASLTISQAPGFVPPMGLQPGTNNQDVMVVELMANGNPQIYSLTMSIPTGNPENVTFAGLFRDGNQIAMGNIVDQYTLRFDFPTVTIGSFEQWKVSLDTAPNFVGNNLDFYFDPYSGVDALGGNAMGNLISLSFNLGGNTGNVPQTGGAVVNVNPDPNFFPPMTLAPSAPVDVLSMEISGTGNVVIDDMIVDVPVGDLSNFSGFDLYRAGLYVTTGNILGNQIEFNFPAQAVSAPEIWRISSFTNSVLTGGNVDFVLPVGTGNFPVNVIGGNLMGVDIFASFEAGTGGNTPPPAPAGVLNLGFGAFYNPPPTVLTGGMTDVEVLPLAFVSNGSTSLKSFFVQVPEGTADLASAYIEDSLFQTYPGTIVGNGIEFNGLNRSFFDFEEEDYNLKISLVSQIFGNAITFKVDPFTDVEMNSGNVSGGLQDHTYVMSPPVTDPVEIAASTAFVPFDTTLRNNFFGEVMEFEVKAANNGVVLDQLSVYLAEGDVNDINFIELRSSTVTIPGNLPTSGNKIDFMYIGKTVGINPTILKVDLGLKDSIVGTSLKLVIPAGNAISSVGTTGIGVDVESIAYTLENVQIVNNITDVTAEINPQNVQVHQVENFVVDFTPYFQSGDNGFDTVKVMFPPNVKVPLDQTVGNVVLSSATTSAGPYTPITPSSYIFNSTNFGMILASTSATSFVYYKLAFDAEVVDPNPETHFDLVLNNSLTPAGKPAFPADVDGDFNNNNDLSVNAFGTGTGAAVLNSAIAEISPEFVERNSTQMVTIYSKLTHVATDAGFNRIYVNIPGVSQQPVTNISLSLDYIPFTADEVIVDNHLVIFKFNTLQTPADIQISFEMFVDEFAPDVAVFDVEFDNSAKLNPFKAAFGDADLVAENSNSLQLNTFSNNISYFVDSFANAELLPNGVAAGSSANLNVVVRTTMAGSDSWKVMKLHLPEGFTFQATGVELVTNGVTLVEGTDFSVFEGPSNLDISFVNSQSVSKTYAVKMPIIAPASPVNGIVEVFLDHNYIAPGVTGKLTNGKGELGIGTYLDVSSTPVLSSISAELIPQQGTDAATVVDFNVNINTTVNTGDSGFNVFSIRLPDAFSQVAVSSVSKNGTPISSANLTTTINNVDGLNVIELSFTGGVENDFQANYNFTLSALLPEFPELYNVEIFASNFNNWNPKYAVGTYPGALEINVLLSNYGTAPNVTHIDAELGVEGGTVEQGAIGKFTVYFRPELTGTQAFDIINLYVDAVPSNVKLFKDADTTARTQVAGVTVTPDFNSVIKLTTPIGVLDSGSVYGLEFSAQVPNSFFEFFASLSINNTANFLSFPDPAFDGDVVSSVTTNAMFVPVTFKEASGQNVTSLEYEVAPGSVDAGAEVTFDVYAKVGMDSSSLGYNQFKVFYSPLFGTPTNITIAKTTIPGSTSFESLSASAYTSATLYDGELEVNLTDKATSSSDNVYKISFTVTAPDFAGEEYFFVEVNNEDNYLPFHGFPTNVTDAAQNDSDRVNVLFAGDIAGKNVADLISEVITYTTSGTATNDTVFTDSTVSVGVLNRVTLEAGDQGFNKIGIEYPFDFSVSDRNSVSVATGVDGLNVLTKNVDYTIHELGDGLLSILLTTAVSAPQTGVSNSWFVVKFNAKTPSFPIRAYFGSFVDNSSNPAPFYGFFGDAEFDPQTGLSSALFVRDSMDFPVKADTATAQYGLSVASLGAELEVNNPPALTNSSVDVTVIVKPDFTGAEGFTDMELIFPPMFARTGAVTISTSASGNALTSVTTTNVEQTAYDPEKVKFSFNSVQKSNSLTFYLKFKVATSFIPEVGFFDVFVKNKTLLGSEFYAFWQDVDSDNQFGTLELFTAAAAGTGQNVSSFNYEAFATTQHGGVDVGAVDADSTPVWQIVINPTLVTSDQGFDLISLYLPSWLEPINPANIAVSRVLSTDTIVNSTPNMKAGGVAYSVSFPDPFSMNIQLTTAQTAAVAADMYVVSFTKKVSPYPDFMYVDVQLDNTTNSLPTYGQFGPDFNADGALGLSAKNDAGFAVNGAYSTSFNVSSASAEVVTTKSIKSDASGSFSIYLKADVLAADKGFDIVNIFYPFDLTNIKITTISSTTDVSSTSLDTALTAIDSVDYSVNADAEGMVEIDFGSAFTETSILKIDINVNTPPYPMTAFIDVDVDNASNYNAFFAFTDDINNDGVAFNDFTIEFSQSINELKPIATEVQSELVVSPEAGALSVVPGSKPTFSVVFKPTIGANDDGFNLFEMFTPPGFALPTKKNASQYAVYKTTPGGTETKLQLNVDYNIQSDDPEAASTFGKVTVKFLVDQGVADTGSVYRVEFPAQAPEFDTFGFMDVLLTKDTNPIAFWPYWGDVVDGTTLYTNGIDFNWMEVEVLTPFNAAAALNVTELFAEMTHTPDPLDASTEAEFTILVKPVIGANDSGINRIGIEVPYGFTAPKQVQFVKVNIDQTTSVTPGSSQFQADNSLLLIKLDDIDTDTNDHYFRVTFKSKSFDVPGFAYFGVAVDNSNNRNLFHAFDADVDGDLIAGPLGIEVLQKALDLTTFADDTAIDSFFDTIFTPTADELIVETTPGSATVSETGKQFTTYITAKNVNGQRGFDILKVLLPYDFSVASAISVFQYTNENGSGNFTQLIDGAGLKADPSASADDPVFGNHIGIKLSTTYGAAADVTFKVVYNASMPDYPSAGIIFAEVDDSAFSFPSFAFPGDAFTESATDTNDSIVFIEPDLTQVDFNKRPLADFRGEIHAPEATVGQTVNVTYYLYADVQNTDTDTGFNFMELFIPFSLESLNLGGIQVSSAPAANVVTGTEFNDMGISSTKMVKTDFSVKINLGESNNLPVGTPHMYKVVVPVKAADFPGLYFFDVRVFNTNFPGIDQLPVIGDVLPAPIAPEDSFEVSVAPDISNIDLTAAPTFPVEIHEAESYPNFIGTKTLGTFTVVSKLEMTELDSGYDQIRIKLPPGFSKPSKVSVTMDAISSRKLETSQYTETVSEKEIIITLNASKVAAPIKVAGSANTISYTTVSFDTTSGGFPGFDVFDVIVGNSSFPMFDVPAAWADINLTSGDGSLSLDVYPNFAEDFVFSAPVDTLVSEVNATANNGAQIYTSTSTRVEYYISATSDSGNAGGFNQVGLVIPPDFGAFPSKVSVRITTDSGVLSEGLDLVQDTASGYTLDLNNPYEPKINFSSNFGTVKMIIGFDIITPEDPNLYFLDLFVDNSEIPNRFHPLFGLEDIDGDSTDGNFMDIAVYPAPIVVDPTSNLYVVDKVDAELNSDDILTGKGATVTMDLRVSNTAGTGFDRLALQVDPDFTFGGIGSITLTTSAGTKSLISGIDYNVKDSDPENIRIVFSTLQSAAVDAAGYENYQVKFKINASDFPKEGFFGVKVDNSELRQPVYGIPGDANDILTDRNALFVNVIPDRTAVYTEAALAIENVDHLYAEAVVETTSGEIKDVEAGSSANIRVYIQPEFHVIGTTNRGINKVTLYPPVDFGTPSNVVVYIATDAGRVKLEKDNINYKSTISATDNKVVIDFSGAQRTAYKLLDNSNISASENTHLQVEFKSQMPAEPNEYFIGVEADHKTVSLPKFAKEANVNGDDDDNKDGNLDSFGDNSASIRVIPKAVDQATFEALVNVSAVGAEITSNNFAEIGSTTSVSLAIDVTVGSTDAGFDRVFLELPSEFSNLSGFEIAYATSAGEALNTMTVITDYTVKLDNPEKVRISLTTPMSASAIFYTTMNADLPTRTGKFPFGVVVDNSVTPKGVAAKAVDVLAGVGTDALDFFVDPKQVVITAETAAPLSSLTAKVAGPSSVSINQTTTVSLDVTAVVGSTDSGFNVVEIRSPEMTNFTDFKVVETVTDTATSSVISSAKQLLNVLDYKVSQTDTGASIVFTTPFSSGTSASLSLSFSATSGSAPGAATFEVDASSTELPFVIPAKLDPATGSRLEVTVVPARKTAAELAQKPAKPVRTLSMDVTPLEATVNTATPITVFIHATSDQGVNDEVANIGFDQIVVALPKRFGTISNSAIIVKTYDSIAYTSGTTLLEIKDYTLSQDANHNLTVKLLKNVLTGTDAYVSVELDVTMPSKPQAYQFRVDVDNSKAPLKVGAKFDDLNGDGKKNQKVNAKPLVVVNPGVVTLTEIVSGAVGSIRYAIDTATTQNIYPGVSEKAFAYKLRVKPVTSTASVGFDSINVKFDRKFKNFKLNSVRTFDSAGNSLLVPVGTTGYTSETDKTEKIISVNFGSIQFTSSSSSSVVFYELELQSDLPPIKGFYPHRVELFNNSLAQGLEIGDGIVGVATDGETGSLALDIRTTNTGTTNTKSGFFSELTPATPILDALTGVVRVNDPTSNNGTGGFVDTIVATTAAFESILVQTTPVVGTNDGFDYMQIEIPFGSSIPSSVLVYTTGSGNVKFLQEHFDYQLDVNEAGITLEFVNEAGVSTPIDAAKMGSDTSLNVLFEMSLPQRLGKHFFDVFVLNTSVPGEIFYVDNGINGRAVDLALIQRTADIDGTKFMTIEVTAPNATTTLSSLAAEFEAIGQNEVPVSASRNFRLDVQSTVNAGESFDHLEVQLPFGFSGIKNVSLDLNNTTLALFNDYNVDVAHPGSIGITFTTPRSASELFTLRFNAQTPAQIQGITSKVDYQFAVVASETPVAGVALNKAPNFAIPTNVTLSNGSNDLTIGVISNSYIGGSIALSNPVLADTVFNTELIKVAADGTETIVPTAPGIPVAVTAGSSQVSFVISQQSDKSVSGIDDGTYKVRVSAYQYGTVVIDNIVIANASKVTGLFATMTANSVQAVASFDPAASMREGTTGSFKLMIDASLSGGIANLDTVKVAFNPTATAVDTFTSIDVTSWMIDGVAQDVALITKTTSGFEFAAAAFTASNSNIELMLSVATAATQSGLFNVDIQLVSGVDSFKASSKTGLSTTDDAVYFNVGAPVAFTTTAIPAALLDQSYQYQLSIFPELSGSDAVYSAVGLENTGLTVNSSGLLSGTPVISSATGLPFSVSVAYTIRDSNGVVTDSGSISKDFSIQVFKEGFAIYSVEPAAVPTTGGEVVVRGVGFELTSSIKINEQVTTTQYIDQNTMILSVPAGLAQGSVSISVKANSVSEDYALLPNSINSQSLVIAQAEVITKGFEATVTEGVDASVLDYDIVGLQNFYQGSIRDILVAAFGPYDINQWRVFGYEDTYFELDTVNDTSKLRAGSGFWRISRVAGSVTNEGIPANNLESYTVAVPARSWALVVNMYDADIAWEGVTVLAGKNEAPVVTTVGSPDNVYTNVTLWGMDKAASDLTKPYKPEALMAPGKGYWVYNKSSQGIAVRMDKPVTGVQSKAARTLYKPEENTPPEAPVAVQAAGAANSLTGGAAAAGGGGGCFLK